MDWDPTNHAVITRNGNSQRTNSKTVVRPSPSQLHLRPAKWQTKEQNPLSQYINRDPGAGTMALKGGIRNLSGDPLTAILPERYPII